MSINTKVLIDLVSAETDLPKADVKRVFDSLANQIGKGLSDNGEVNLANIGKFKASYKAARTGRNPQTGEAVEIPARTAVKLTVAKTLKEAVN